MNEQQLIRVTSLVSQIERLLEQLLAAGAKDGQLIQTEHGAIIPKNVLLADRKA